MPIKAAAHLPPRIREYEVWGRIGGGGMSDVFLARHEVLSVPVVIKTLRTEVGEDANTRLHRLVNEARLSARIASHHIVRPLDAGLERDTPYLVQEYVDGLDLNEFDKRRRRALKRGLPLWFVCQAMAEIADGLHAAHQTGVLHRDLKPSNLLFSFDGHKLGDFGIAIAKAYDRQAPDEREGTLRFMSPEALRGDKLDRRADVFSLGATAYDLRYGHPPFPDPKALLQGRARVAFPPPTSPQEASFQHVIGRMLAYERVNRYRDLVEPRRHFAQLAKQLRRQVRASVQPDGSFVFGKTRIIIEEGDISLAKVCGIISSAYYEMTMRAGVGDALRRRGGDIIEEEAMRDGEQPLGACVVTSPGALSCRYVLHAVSAWKEASCIGRAMQRALLLAEELDLPTLAIPALGTGAGRITIEASANAIMRALTRHLMLGGSRLSTIHCYLDSPAKLRAFREVAEGVLLGESDEATEDTGLADELGDEPSPHGPTLHWPNT